MVFCRNVLLIFLIQLGVTGCFSYSFTGVSIPSEVKTIHFPFFQDQSSAGLANLPDILNEALLTQFVNQSRLRFSTTAEDADALLEGRISGYTNKLAIVGSAGTAQLQEVSITVTASFRYKTDAKPVFTKTFTANAQYDPNTDPIEGERNAARSILATIARNMFTDSLAKW